MQASASAVADGACGVDQADVAECLREVADGFSGVGVDFFGEQADVVGVGDGGPERLFGRCGLAGQGEGMGQPEGAKKEGPFPAGQSVRGGVAAHKTASVGEVRAYLRATARTVLAAHWRETMGREITSIEDIEQPPDSEEAISTAPQRVAVVLQGLPEHYRRILELRFLQGISIKESAAELGVSIANAKVLQHRALRLAAQVNQKGES